MSEFQTDPASQSTRQEGRKIVVSAHKVESGFFLPVLLTCTCMQTRISKTKLVGSKKMSRDKERGRQRKITDVKKYLLESYRVVPFIVNIFLETLTPLFWGAPPTTWCVPCWFQPPSFRGIGKRKGGTPANGIVHA